VKRRRSLSCLLFYFVLFPFSLISFLFVVAVVLIRGTQRKTERERERERAKYSWQAAVIAGLWSLSFDIERRV